MRSVLSASGLCGRSPEPWHSFFAEIDRAFDHPVVLHCIGGFALAMLYDLPRPTVDVDCLSVIPVADAAPLQSLAGEGSALHKKYVGYFQHIGMVTVPEKYTDRLILMFPTAYRQLLMTGLEAHDLALSKLERNSARDREDVKYLARAVPLDLSVLESRYRGELRPYLANTERHDLTLRLWFEMLSGASGVHTSRLSLPSRLGRQTSLYLGTLSPSPWDLTLSRQNGCHLGVSRGTLRVSWQPRPKSSLLTGRIFGDPNWPVLG